MPVKTLHKYKNWQPLPHTVIKDELLQKTIHEKGYAVIPFLSAEQLALLIEFYNKEHTISNEKGGMFYSVYSKNLDYRKKVNETIGSILQPNLNELFTNYRNVLNTFITKVSGPESEFYTHQDTTATDEFRYSPLSVWIPLQDITPENGALGVVEKSHWFFSPYRGVSFPFPFSKINNTVSKYLKPVYLKAGEALIFDPRIIHNSMSNHSGKDRLVALCGIFPENAELITCFRSKEHNSKIELIRHEDVYLLENESFFYDCHARPQGGTSLGYVDEDFPEMDAVTFEELCRMNAIEQNDAAIQNAQTNCRFIAEPDGQNLDSNCEIAKADKGTIWKKVKKIFT